MNSRPARPRAGGFLASAVSARDRFLAPDRLVGAVVAIASGVEALTGRYLGALEDIQAVTADAPFIINDDRRVLRISGSQPGAECA